MTRPDNAPPAPGLISVSLAGALLCGIPQILAALLVGDAWPPPVGMAPALGLAVALSIVWGNRALPGILGGLVLGALLARDLVEFPISLVQSGAWAFSATIGAALAGHGIRLGGRAPLSSLAATRDFLIWGVLAAALAPAASTLPLAPAGEAVYQFTLDLGRLSTGTLVFGALGLAALHATPEQGQLRRGRVVAFFLAGAVLLAIAFGISDIAGRWSGLAAGLILPLLLIAGLRLPASVVISGNAAVAVVSAGASAAGLGPFAIPRLNGSGPDLIAIFAYAATASTIALLAIGAGAELTRAGRNGRRKETGTGSAMARIRALLDNAPVAAGLLSRDSTLIYANGGYSHILGYPGHDMTGADISRFIADPSDRILMLQRLEQDSRLENYEYRLRRADGDIRWVQESWAPVDVDGQSLILAWTTDVTERKLAEEQLRTSERRLRSILDESPVAVVISRPGGRILYANPRAAGLVGLPRALLIGANGGDFYAEYDQRQRMKTVMRSGGAVVNEEITLRAADGQHRTCLFSLLPMEFDGAPARLAWSFDITFRKRAEEELRKSEARLRSILEASPLAMGVIDRRGRLRYANTALLDQFALTAHEAIGQRTDNLIATPMEARALRHRLFKRRTQLRGVEAELRRSDGSTFWGLLSFEMGIFEGTPVLFAWSADITERKEAERALTAHRDRLERAVEISSQAQEVLNHQLSRELEERKRAEARIRRNQTYLRTVLDTVADGIITIDSHGLIEDFNPAAERIFSYQRDAVIGRNISILMPEPDRSYHDEYLRRFLRGEGSQFVGAGREVTGLRADGSTFPLYLAISAAQVGERTVFTGVLRDITAQKRAETAMREAKETAELANRTKSEFLANMSHELRTPLNAIIGFSEMIKSEIMGPIGTPTYLDYVSDIHASGRHLLDVINDILDIARVEAGRMTLFEESVDVAASARSCLKLVRTRADETGLSLITDIPDNLPHLRGDPRRIKQILLNLLSNAVKFTPEGGTVTLTLAANEKGMQVIVADTGPGMTAAEARDALQPFVQVDAGLERRYEGTGLGLPLVAAMVEMHGGTLILDTARGNGTRAIIRLPADRLVLDDHAETTAPTSA